ncbi:recombinase family protein [Rhizobium leguminosarum]|uniref:recombinase family protein n=1 Tax=Rhizobium leguminosarum TaxID=384 RepID=UPI0028F4576E|nr:recombinase family protein [Rhizobium leguminosarum]
MLSGQTPIDTSIAQGKRMFGIFASRAEFERELIRERTVAGLDSARARGRRATMTPAKIRPAQAATGQPGIVVADLCSELTSLRTITESSFVDGASD